MEFADLLPGYGFLRTIGGNNYLFSVGAHTTGKGYVYTNLAGCSCFEPEYLDVSGNTWPYWVFLD